MYPDLEAAYELTDEPRRIYSSTKKKAVAYTKLAQWYRHVEEAGYDSFQVVKETVYENYPDILNFFENRSTNASAESFNSNQELQSSTQRCIRCQILPLQAPEHLCLNT